jgi:hypothetical protein
MEKLTFNEAHIYLGVKNSKTHFEKVINNTILDSLRLKLIGKYNYRSYSEKSIYDKNMIFRNNTTYKYKTVHHYVLDDHMFFELLEMSSIPNINFILKKKYNYEELHNIDEFIISDKIKVLINDANSVVIKATKDAYWDITYPKLMGVLSMIRNVMNH